MGDPPCSEVRLRVECRYGYGSDFQDSPVLVGKVAGDQEGGNRFGRGFVGEGVPAVHESDGPSNRFSVGFPEGAHYSVARSRCAANAFGPFNVSNNALVIRRLGPVRRLIVARGYDGVPHVSAPVWTDTKRLRGLAHGCGWAICDKSHA